MRRLLLLIALLAFTPLALAANTATLTWTAVTTHTDGTPTTGAITYNIYQGACGAEVLVQNRVTTLTATISTGLTGGSTVCWIVTAVEAGGGESAFSNEGRKTFPTINPAATTLTVT